MPFNFITKIALLKFRKFTYFKWAETKKRRRTKYGKVITLTKFSLKFLTSFGNAFNLVVTMFEPGKRQSV